MNHDACMAPREPPHFSEPTVDVARYHQRSTYKFRDPGLLRAALARALGAQQRLASNKRLKFLGDAILGFVIYGTPYRLFPDSLEGLLARVQSVAMNLETCGRLRTARAGPFFVHRQGPVGAPARPPARRCSYSQRSTPWPPRHRNRITSRSAGSSPSAISACCRPTRWSRMQAPPTARVFNCRRRSAGGRALRPRAATRKRPSSGRRRTRSPNCRPRGRASSRA